MEAVCASQDSSTPLAAAVAVTAEKFTGGCTIADSTDSTPGRYRSLPQPTLKPGREKCPTWMSYAAAGVRPVSV